jgi:DNA-binding transcriptional MerR regulator
MIDDTQEISDKLFYSIGEVAEIFKVNTSLIRFWEKEFDVIKPSKNKKGNRLFTQNDLEQFKIIFYLVKEKGYTLQGAKQLLKDQHSSLKSEVEIIEKLNKIKSFLISIKKEL